MAVFSSDMHARRERALKEDTSLNSMTHRKHLLSGLYFFPRVIFADHIHLFAVPLESLNFNLSSSDT